MKLYYNLLSTNSRRALAAVYHVDQKIELQSVDFTTGFIESSEFMKLNPNGMLPVLQDGNFSLWESNAIMQYVCTKFNNTSIYPTDSQMRADINRWQFWVMSHFGPACDTLMWENMMKKMFDAGSPDATKVAEATEEFHTYAKVLDQHLSSNSYLVGNSLTIADYSVAANLTYFQQSHFPIQGYSNILNWYKKVESQDAWKKSAPKF